VLIAIPQASYGAHYEIGVAVGYGLPVVLLVPENDGTSFIMRGLPAIKNVIEIHFSSTADLAQKLLLRLNDLAIGFRA